MKKLSSFALIVLLSFTLTNTFAQGKNYLGIGANLALPMGSFSDVAGVGIGGTASFEMEFTPNITGIATAGYLSFGGKDFSGPDYSYSYGYSDIPIMAGIKYYFTPGVPFYGIGQIGFQIFNSNYDYQSTIPGYEFSFSGSSESSTEFAFAIGAGYEIPAGANGVIDITGTFNIISNLNYLGARVAYRFGI
jgi:opacity protein-like surface antigen